MNTLILECKKFIRSRVFVVILGVILVLLASLFYKNYLNYQQVDADKKHELLMIKKEIGEILYPADGKSPSIYSGDKDKMDLLKKSLEISEKTLKLKHSGDDRAYMESAILMYEKIIEIKENEINFSMSKSYAQHEKERLSEIIKVNGTYQYEEAPLDGVLVEYNNIKYILSVIFLMALSYFFITTYLDFYYHKGFLFTLPIKKTSFIVSKAIISFIINIVLIISQFGLSLVFSYFWKWKIAFDYPVFHELAGGFLPVKKALLNYIEIEIAVCFIALLISTVLYSLYIKIKK
ncbi:hypothetical protein VJI77_03195 [Parvimonas sp. D2]|uniref:hypothetical protein n=1 Tax=unclassified Parvimonas TaxID=1151464 RepID=UPI002B49FA9A|nr:MULTISPECIES: hypothetical protein [unclassified Parvimonas]MEB3011998.1 hypothetical protein [Parvimonas sp. D2]MEB3087569.1 hypothetical protein [Parvimonas sp. D4]